MSKTLSKRDKLAIEERERYKRSFLDAGMDPPATITCPTCGGTASHLIDTCVSPGKWRKVSVPCAKCKGTGRVPL